MGKKLSPNLWTKLFAVPPSLDSLFIFCYVRAGFQYFIPNLAPKVHSGAGLPQAFVYFFAVLALGSSVVWWGTQEMNAACPKYTRDNYPEHTHFAIIPTYLLAG